MTDNNDTPEITKFCKDCDYYFESGHKILCGKLKINPINGQDMGGLLLKDARIVCGFFDPQFFKKRESS